MAQINKPLIQNKNVTQGDGEPVNFTCSISHDEMADIDVTWTVGSRSYNSCDVMDEALKREGCFDMENRENNATTSVLTITDTTSLIPGMEYTVECAVIQMFDQNFTNDPSYNASHFPIRKSVTLTVNMPGNSVSLHL